MVDGEAKGRIAIKVENYPLVAYKIPRSSVKKDTGECKHINNSSIYFLFGEKEGAKTVYVGQAAMRKDGKGPLRRILEPHSDDVWKSALIITTNSNELSSSSLKYLENYFYNLAKDARNYVLTTRVEPTSDYSISDKDKRLLKQMIEHICAIVELLGYRVFIPKTTESKNTDSGRTKKASTSTTRRGSDKITPFETEIPIIIKPHVPSGKSTEEKSARVNKGPLFYCRRRSADAKGYLLRGGQFVLLRGSRLSPEEPNSYYLTTFINKLEKFKGKLDGNLVLEDILFKTPSAASAFVIKTNSRGNVDWSLKNGMKMGVYLETKCKKSTEKLAEKNPDPMFRKRKQDADIKDNATPKEKTTLDTILFFCDQRGAEAKGYYNPESGTFTVLQGSRITSNPFANHVVNNGKRWREMQNLCEKYGRFLKSDGVTFATDVTFDKPSTSARFILKSVVNGKMAWHDENGNSLKSYMDE